MSDKSNQLVKDLVAHLKGTGTGVSTLEMIQAWGDQNPEADADAILCWAEDLHQKDNRQMMEGTLQKIGLHFVGDSYGIRKPGESHSQENQRLQEEVNQLRKQLETSNGGSNVVTAQLAVKDARIKSLETENAELKRQIDILCSKGEAIAAPEHPTNELPSRRAKGGIRKVRNSERESGVSETEPEPEAATA